MSNVYELGDLLVTREYDGQKVEVCVYKGNIGSLFLTIGDCLYWHMERFVRNCDSLPYATRVIRKEDAKSFFANSNQSTPA